MQARAERRRARLVAGIGGRSGQPARRGRTAGAGEDFRPRAGALEAGRHRGGVRDRAAAAVRAECATTKAREAVCRAFADAYVAEGAKLPAETQEGRYFDRLVQAYPIHPEVFDRLYEDWTTIDGFQRTRGVLKLMAKVIYRLWKDDNKDLMILPGSLPLYDGSTRNELTYYLPAGWDAVIEKDIDGDRAETTELENKEPRFGPVNAARRVARTMFLGSAPSSVPTKPGIRGLDRARVLLGCLQPGQTSATYADALNRLADRLHYLNSSGDKAQDATRFWFDTRANLRREMEDRKRRFDDGNDVRGKIGRGAQEARRQLRRSSTASTSSRRMPTCPDDGALRLVVLPPGTISTPERRPAGLRRRAGIRAQQRHQAAIPRQSADLPRPGPWRAGPPARCRPRGAGVGFDCGRRRRRPAEHRPLQKKQAEKELDTAPRTCCRARPASATSGCSARCSNTPTDRSRPSRHSR